MLPNALIGLVLHAYQDHSVRRTPRIPTQVRSIRQKYWWPTTNRDVYKWCLECQACQRRKTAHNRPKLPTGHLPVERPFHRISVDLVEYKSESISNAGVKGKIVLSIMDDLTRFTLLTLIPNKSAETVAKAIIDRIIGISVHRKYYIPIAGRSLKIR